MCDLGHFFIEISDRHIMFKLSYIQMTFLRIFCVNQVFWCTFTVNHSLCLDSFIARSYFANQIERCVILIIFVDAQRTQVHRFFSLRFWEVTWSQNNLFFNLLNNKMWDVVCIFFTRMIDRLTSSCSDNEDCEFVNNCILLNEFMGQFLCKYFFNYSQNIYLLQHNLFIYQN